MPFRDDGTFYSTVPPFSGGIALKLRQLEEGITEAATRGTGMGVGEDNVQADWTEGDPNSDSFIQHKPVIPTGMGEENVQSDWTEANTAADAFIQNKPTIETLPDVTQAQAEAGTDQTRRAFTVQRVWQAIRAALPTVTQALAVAGTSTALRTWTALRVRQAINAVVPSATGEADGRVLTVDSGAWVAADATGMGGGEENVQADWDATDTTSDAYIQNKPTIPDTTPAGVSGARVGLSNNLGNQDFTTAAVLSWTEEIFDEGDWWDSATPGRLTVPAGVTHVVVSGGVRLRKLAADQDVMFDFSTGPDIAFDFLKSGSALGIGYSSRNAVVDGEDWKAGDDTGLLAVVEGDYFEVSLGGRIR